MNVSYVELSLEKNLNANVFILPYFMIRNQEEIDQYKLQYLSKEELLLNKGRIPLKSLGKKVFVAVSNPILIHLVRGLTSISGFEATISVEADFPVSIANSPENASSQKEIPLNMMGLNAKFDSKLVMIKPEKDGIVQVSIKGTIIIEQKKLSFHKKFVLESALPFDTSVRVSHLKNYDYLMEITASNSMPFALNKLEFTFSPASNLECHFHSLQFNGIGPNSQISQTLPFVIDITKNKVIQKKLGKLEARWIIEPQSERVSDSIEEPSLEKIPMVPDYLLLRLIKWQGEATQFSPFSFVTRVLNVSSNELGFKIVLMNSNSMIMPRMNIDSYQLNPGQSVDISFSAIPAKEGLQDVPSILFILSNRAEFRYIPKLTVFVHPMIQTND